MGDDSETGGRAPSELAHVEATSPSVHSPASSASKSNADVPDLGICVLKWQSLLMQFVHPQVRRDFLSGMLDVESNSSLLIDLDQIRAIIIPPWRGSSETSLSSQLAIANHHVTSLAKRTTEVFDVGDRLWTYAAWSRYLNKITKATYWKFTPPSSICIERLSVNIDVPLSPANRDMVKREDGSAHERPNERPRQERDVLPSAPDASSRTHSEPPLRSGAVKKKKRIEEIQLSDTSESESTETTTDNSSSQPTRRRRSRRQKKEPVKPLIFDADSGSSLRAFLSAFERYFYRKYEGNSKDCSQELSNFLTGEIRQYYEALGGRKLRFPDMKNKLLSWYKARHMGGTQHWRDKLHDTRIEAGESLRLYGTRLQEIGERAYPHSERDRLREIKRHFLKTVPQEFTRRIQEGESVMRLIDANRRMTWAEILNIADREFPLSRTGRSEQKSSQVWYSRGETKTSVEKSEQVATRKPHSPQNKNNEFQRNAPSRKPHSPQNKNHEFRRNAPSRSPRNRRQQGWSSGKNNLPIDGIPVPDEQHQISRPQALCNWCGRPGHFIENCWSRLGSCPICGDPEHRRDECQRYRLRLLQLICPNCSGSHAGKDCTNTMPSNSHARQ